MMMLMFIIMKIVAMIMMEKNVVTLRMVVKMCVS